MEENQPEMVKCKYSVHFVLCPPDKTCGAKNNPNLVEKFGYKR